jgi:hypothetical protein
MIRCSIRPTPRPRSPEIELINNISLDISYLGCFARDAPDIALVEPNPLNSLKPDISPTYPLFLRRGREARKASSLPKFNSRPAGHHIERIMP